MFGSNPSGASIFGATGTSGSNNPTTIGSAGTLFSSTALSNTTATTQSNFGTSGFTGFGAVPATKPFSFVQPASTMTMASGTSGLFGSNPSAATATTNTTFSGQGTSGFSFPSQASTNLGSSQLTGFGGTLGSTAVSSAPSLSLGLLGAPSSSAPSIGIGNTGSTTGTVFGTPLPTSTVAPSLGLGMFGTPATTTTPASSIGLGLFGSTTASTTVTPFVGLGGISAAQTSAGDTKSDTKALKEYPVPPEIVTLTEEFKKYIKDQKNIREEISHVSSKSLSKVQDETTGLKQLLSVVSTGIQRNTASIAKLKQETIQELTNAEVMQRTKDIPLALQYENTAPMEYFQKLISTFENKMEIYRQQITIMESHLASIMQPSVFTPQDLMLTIKKLHETFIFLAAQLHTIHEAIEQQKERFLVYRRLVHGDNTNPFETLSIPFSSGLKCVPRVTTGPSPFTGTQTAAAFASALEKAQQPSGAPPTLGLSSSTLGTPFGISSGLSGTSAFGTQPFSTGSNLLTSSSSLSLKPLGSSSTGFGTSGFGSLTPATPGTSTSSPAFGVANQPFQLQKPPTGNKRGKR